MPAKAPSPLSTAMGNLVSLGPVQATTSRCVTANPHSRPCRSLTTCVVMCPWLRLEPVAGGWCPWCPFWCPLGSSIPGYSKVYSPPSDTWGMGGFPQEPLFYWWSQTDSNRRHPACKAGALPTELWPQLLFEATGRHAGPEVVGLAGLEPATSSLSGMRSNHLSYKPKKLR